jgi:hypothetical protein
MEEDNRWLRSLEVQLIIELENWKKTIEAWEVLKYIYNWTWKLVEDNCNLWSLKYNCNWIWPKKQQDVARMKEVKE